jgi:serine/threonine protein kinase
LINQTEQFAERTARYVFKQLLGVLRHTHACRIAHCDIKSENILLDAKFNVKVVDFGYARYAKDEMAQPINYHVCDGVGSLKCNAPEITNAVSKGEYNAESIDIFAAGCFLFELVMKTEPFKSSDIKDEHYSKLVNFQPQKFWDIFSGKPTPSSDFKGTSSLIQIS